MKKYFNNKSKGFSLIELLVVISVLGLLSSIVFASLSDARNKSINAKQISDSIEVNKAVELYRIDNNGRIPSFENASLNSTLHLEGSPEYNQVMGLLVDGGYISKIPSSSNEAYAYMASGDRESAVFFSDQNEEVGGKDLCKYVGSYDFGQTDGGNSCEGAITTASGSPLACGQPPYIIGTGDFYEENSYGSYSWEMEIYASDPEGQDIYFYKDYITVNPPDSHSSCQLMDKHSVFIYPELPDNAAWLQCWIYDRYRDGVTRTIDFYYQYQTEGCSLEEGYILVE